MAPVPHRRRSARRTALVGGLLALVAIGASAVWAPTSAARSQTSGGWTTDVTASTLTASRGDLVTFEVEVTGVESRRALVDFELYDSDWNKVVQEYWDEMSFTAGESETFEVRWRVPAGSSGQYRARVGIFRPGWGELYHWNDEALVVRVISGPSTSPPPTPTAPPTTVAPPTTPVPTSATTSTAAPPSSTTVTPPSTTTTSRPPSTQPAPTTTAPGPDPVVPPPAGSQFVATFETAADFYDRFQLDVHFRDDGSSVNWAKPISGDHDMSCGGPTSQRTIHAQRHIDGTEGADLRQSQLFWWCAPGDDPTKGHIMTGMGDIDGYTILAFAPNQSFTDVRRVCWDVNLTDMTRKWPEVAVIPEAAYRANGRRIDYISPAVEEVDENAVPYPVGAFAWQLENFANRTYWIRSRPFDWGDMWEDWRPFRTTDRAARFTHCLIDNENGTVTITQERPDGVLTLVAPGDLPDGASRVIFKDHNYTPDKDGLNASYTWHWDDIVIS